MSFPIPSLPSLYASARAAFVTNLPGADTLLVRAVIRVLAKVVAGAAWLQYRYQSNIAAEMFLDTMSSTYLDRRGAVYRMPRTLAAAAGGMAQFAGLPTTPVALGTVLLAPDLVSLFATQAAVTIAAGGTVAVAVVAQTPGSAGNLAPGIVLTLVTASSGLSATVAIIDDGTGHGTTGGLDAELDGSYRARIEQRQATPPQGGAGSDYYAWARAVPGVSRAWVFPVPLAGGVNVAFVIDARTSITPLSADLATVQAAIDALRPVTAKCTVFALAVDAVAVTLANLVATTTIAAAQASIAASVLALFTASASAGGAALGDGIDARHPAGTLSLADLYAAIRAADGVVNFDLVAPSADLASAYGHLAIPVVTFV